MYGYKVTVEDKSNGEKHVLDNLDGFIVATADEQGGGGFWASDFRYHQANFEMVGTAKTMIEDCMRMMHDEFMASADTPEAGEQRYWRAMQEINRIAKEVAEKSRGERR